MSRALIQEIESKFHQKKEIPDFRPGDTVRVISKIKEGERERLQPFEGLVIRRQGGGVRETVTVRRVVQEIGVERIFPLHTPLLERIEVLHRGRVRRAKLNYLSPRRWQGKSRPKDKTVD